MTLRNQQGSALIFVTVVGLVISIAFALLMNSTVLVEQRAVDGELAKSRAYWAQMGNFDYAMSRISYSRLCNGCASGNNKDTDLASVLQAYFAELSNNQTWTYLDEASGYSITTTDAAAADNTPGRQNFSGYLMATSAYTASSQVSGLSQHLPVMELRLCVGLPNGGAHCGNINNNNGGKATAYFSINRLTNLPAP